MAENILNVSFAHRHVVVAKGLYQYDYGQKLQIAGITLPPNFEVHFCNDGDFSTIPMIGTDYMVDIPDQFLTTGKDIIAYIYHHEGEDDGETIEVVRMPVVKRPVPTDGEPTPAQETAISQAIALLQQELEQVDQYTLTYTGNSYHYTLRLKKNDSTVNSVQADQTASADSTNLITSAGAYKLARWYIDNSNNNNNPNMHMGLALQIEPFILYSIGYVESLSIYYKPTTVPSDGYEKEYRIRFIVADGETPTITLPTGVTMQNGFNPTGGHTYEIHIYGNKYATFAEWEI